jgi:hypothetical protein
MSESMEVEKKFNTWKEVSSLLKPVYEKLDGRKSKKEWHYKIQLGMLLTKAEEYAATYEEILKQSQEVSNGETNFPK